MAVLVKFVGRAGAVVDQVGEPEEALGVTRAAEEVGEFGRRPGARLGDVASERITGWAWRNLGPATCPVAPSERSETVEAAENGVRARVAWVRAGVARSKLRATGVPASEKDSSEASVPRNSRRKAGSFASDSSSSSPRSVVASAAAHRVGEEAGDAGAVAGERLEDLLTVDGELGQFVTLVVELLDQGRRVAQDRVGALDDLLEVLATTGERRPQFVEDQAEALCVGQALDVVDQVRIDAGAVALDRQQVLTGAGLAVRDLLEGWRRRSPRGSWLVGRQSTTFSPISDWGRITQLASRRKSVKPSSLILSTSRALPGASTRLPVLEAGDFAVFGHGDFLDRADLGAGGAHFATRRDESAAVENRADQVAVVAVVAAGSEEGDHDDRDDPDDDQRLLHGPGGTSFGSQSDGVIPAPAIGGSVNGLEPSAAGWVPPPGQRVWTGLESPKGAI